MAEYVNTTGVQYPSGRRLGNLLPQRLRIASKREAGRNSPSPMGGLVIAVDSPLVTEERIEARREIRQRGENGPAPVDLPFLDEQTSRGEGPVIRIWCEGETVPIEIWQDFVKIL